MKKLISCRATQMPAPNAATKYSHTVRVDATRNGLRILKAANMAIRYSKTIVLSAQGTPDQSPFAAPPHRTQSAHYVKKHPSPATSGGNKDCNPKAVRLLERAHFRNAVSAKSRARKQSCNCTNVRGSQVTFVRSTSSHWIVTQTPPDKPAEDSVGDGGRRTAEGPAQSDGEGPYTKPRNAAHGLEPAEAREGRRRREEGHQQRAVHERNGLRSAGEGGKNQGGRGVGSRGKGEDGGEGAGSECKNSGELGRTPQAGEAHATPPCNSRRPGMQGPIPGGKASSEFWVWRALV